LSARFRGGAREHRAGQRSNDVLDLGACIPDPGHQCGHSQHAFAVYPLAVQAIGATGIEVPARDFGHDLEAMRRAVRFADTAPLHRESQQSNRDVRSGSGS
jgi:histidinol-phosphate aminotransferase